jgi:hypothetical protein
MQANDLQVPQSIPVINPVARQANIMRR